MAELSRDLVTWMLNQENELLTEFKTKAPGTFKHCEEVSMMCEKIGRELKLDTEFLKIIGLYHDIGKMWHPEFFSENQPKDYNIHDSLSPQMSAKFIIGHIADTIAVLVTRVPGIDLSIANTIACHHGDSVLWQFLEKVPQDEKEHIQEQFAYPYKKPDNVYSCILMIVDIVEARIRAAKSVNIDFDSTELIRTIIAGLTNDKNLDELTIKQGRIIAEVLISEYSTLDHKRVSYENK